MTYSRLSPSPTAIHCSTIEYFLKILDKAMSNQALFAAACNRTTSSSHLIIWIRVAAHEATNSSMQPNSILTRWTGSLVFVESAGNESLDVSSVFPASNSGARFQPWMIPSREIMEAAAVSRSLRWLCNFVTGIRNPAVQDVDIAGDFSIGKDDGDNLAVKRAKMIAKAPIGSWDLGGSPLALILEKVIFRDVLDEDRTTVQTIKGLKLVMIGTVSPMKEDLLESWETLKTVKNISNGNFGVELANFIL
ncbi:hypothetical protein HK096_011276 [Nowakowskiella sp. JEL0078]|nr:hypothetical protein HK096_011276 [Nowakowskiella sp. JEL0078]